MDVFFYLVFRSSFGRVFYAISADMGALGEAFGETFRHFLELRGLLLDCTHSEAKTNIFRFWSSQAGTLSSIFPGMDSGCVFN